MQYWGHIGVVLGLYRGYRDNGKENGNYYLGFRVKDLGAHCNKGNVYGEQIEIMEKKMEATI